MAAKKKTSKTKSGAKKKAPATKKKAVAKKKPATKKKAVAKKKPAAKKKAAAKKRPVAKKKAAAKKKPVAKKKASVRKAPTKKTAPSAKKTRASAKGASARKSQTGFDRKAVNRRPVRRVGGLSRLEQLATEREENPPKVKKMGARDREYFRRLLLNLRDQVVDEISFLAGNNLKSQNVATSGEDGTDNFNRESALKLVSSEQDLVYEIDEALNRIRNGVYGVCEVSGRTIERERMKVLPHARHCIEVQSEMERGRTRYRPFGPTLLRSMGD